jgi:diaminohydroxyphosphoribosylaminopyrimidine deaminase/5-amino-6-(5-phosphoribosylamino)uracil reductase
MVEGGGQVAGAFLRCGLVDRIEWFRAPMVLGAEGRPAIGALALSGLAAAPRFRRTEARRVGVDLWERYERV